MPAHLRRGIWAAMVITAAGAVLAGCTAAPTPSTQPTASASLSATAAPPSTPETSGTPSPSASSPASPSASPVASSPASPSPSPVAATACTDLTAVPASASTTRIADGAQETLFLTTAAPWCFGVRTASGVHALADPLPGAGTHAIWGVGTDGATGVAVVLDDGSSAVVYRLQDSRLQQLRARSGGPLTFPVGRTATGGRGVACNDQNGGILIEGSTATPRSDGRVDVLWATVSSVDEAGVAHLDAPEVRYPALPADDARVAAAASSHCSAAPHRATAAHA